MNRIFATSFLFFLALFCVASSAFSAGEPAAGTQKILTDRGLEFSFRYCPPGVFKMSDPIDDEGGVDILSREVILSQGFWLLETPVTQEMWQSVMGTSLEDQKNKREDTDGKSRGTYPLWGEGNHYPMYYLSWEDCQDFCRILSERTGQRILLPTGEQWEYARRGGRRGDDSDSENREEMGWYDDTSDQTTHEVKLKKPNSWGLYDMRGNVYEWCQDGFGDFPSGGVTDPAGSKNDSFHLRHGSWVSGAAGNEPFAIWDIRESIENRLSFRLLLNSIEEPPPFDLTSELSPQDDLFLLEISPEVDDQAIASLPYVGALKEVKIDEISYRFRWSPPGTFLMGSPENEEGRWDKESQHQVTLTRGFWMLETPVTQEMWRSVMGIDIEDQTNKAEDADGKERGTYRLSGEGRAYPVYNVSWGECQEFCKRLSDRMGETVTLPTEAQWEYACRAGSQGAYGDAKDLDEIGWYQENSDFKTHEIRLKKPNAWGLYDMHGNVWEWCQDWYDSYPSEAVIDPTGAESGSDRVCRGGSWLDNASICRSATRGGNAPGNRVSSLGFRIILEGNE